VITDGCTYRRDQIPARTFADCIASCPDYPVNRADFAGPFLDPLTVPADEDFTTWYMRHVKRFFGVDGEDYDWLFGLHTLAHKTCGDAGRTSFDGMCCDGSSNYMKLMREGTHWKVADFKARSFTRSDKELIADWILRTYSRDCYDGPPDITASPSLLAYKQAGQVARVALRTLRHERWMGLSAEVYYPLGLERLRVKVYKVIKPSAFLFCTPRQQAAFVKAMGKFADETSCGLELLALRRGTPERRKGSIADVAGAIYCLVRSGNLNPSKALNLTRPSEELEEVKNGHHLEVMARKGNFSTHIPHNTGDIFLGFCVCVQ
jgi:hypothetical protein